MSGTSVTQTDQLIEFAGAFRQKERDKGWNVALSESSEPGFLQDFNDLQELLTPNGPVNR